MHVATSRAICIEISISEERPDMLPAPRRLPLFGSKSAQSRAAACSVILLDKASQLFKCGSSAGIIVLRPNAWRNVLEQERHFRAAILLLESDDHPHLTGEGAVC